MIDIFEGYYINTMSDVIQKQPISSVEKLQLRFL